MEYLDKVVRSLVLVLPKMSENVKTLKVKEGDKVRNNKMMSFRIHDDKLLEEYNTIGTKIEDNIELNVLPIFYEFILKKSLY